MMINPQQTLAFQGCSTFRQIRSSQISVHPRKLSSPDPAPTNSAARVRRGGCNAAARSAVRLRGWHPGSGSEVGSEDDSGMLHSLSIMTMALS